MQQVPLAVQMHRFSPLLAVRTPSASLSQMLQAIALIGRNCQFRLPSAPCRGLQVPLSKAVLASMHQALLAARNLRFLSRHRARTPLESRPQTLQTSTLSTGRSHRFRLPLAHRRGLRVPFPKAVRACLQQPALAATLSRIRSRNAALTLLVSLPQVAREKSRN